MDNFLVYDDSLFSKTDSYRNHGNRPINHLNPKKLRMHRYCQKNQTDLFFPKLLVPEYDSFAVLVKEKDQIPDVSAVDITADIQDLIAKNA